MSQLRNAQFLKALGVCEPGTAEICEGDLPGIGAAPSSDQHVGRLQILMQHADAMRGRYDRANLNEERHALRGRQSGQRLVRATRPLQQIRSAVGRFEEEWGLIEIPVDQAGDIVANAQSRRKVALQRRLALKRTQAGTALAELVDPLFPVFEWTPTQTSFDSDWPSSSLS